MINELLGAKGRSGFYKAHQTLTIVGAKDVPEGSTKHRFAFEVQAKEKSVLLCARSRAEKQMWLKDLNVKILKVEDATLHRKCLTREA